MEKPVGEKRWRLEVSNPVTSTDWRLLWEFDDDERLAYEELSVLLNQINRPVLLRIVRNSH